MDDDHIVVNCTAGLTYLSTLDNPHHRFRKYIESKGWWSKEDEDAVKVKQKREVMEGFKKV
jgi:TPP-dependent pyruvate/acetoin dehydrogenase alpha subunit